MNLDQALETFIAESRDLLQAMEDALLSSQNGKQDADAVNAIFRAAHTIKGSAGLFGLDDMVAFTHALESVLDQVRGGELAHDAELVALLLCCRDHLGALVESVAVPEQQADPKVEAQGAHLSAQLSQYLQASAPTAAEPPTRTIASSPDTPEYSARTLIRHWHISVRFGPDVLRNGMDPLSFIRYLGTLGELLRVETLTDAMPEAERMDPEACYLGFEIALKIRQQTACRSRTSSSSSTTIARCAFCRRAAASSDYIDLIRALPEDDLRLGEILVRCGTLTRARPGRCAGPASARDPAAS